MVPSAVNTAALWPSATSIETKGANRPDIPLGRALSELAGQIVRARSGLAERLDKDRANYTARFPAPGLKSAWSTKPAGRPPTTRPDYLKSWRTAWSWTRTAASPAAGPHREDLAGIIQRPPGAGNRLARRDPHRRAGAQDNRAQIIEDLRGVPPLLLLDDVFSELDGKRRHALTDYLAPYQTFITTTDADAVVGHFTESANIIPLR